MTLAFVVGDKLENRAGCFCSTYNGNIERVYTTDITIHIINTRSSRSRPVQYTSNPRKQTYGTMQIIRLLPCNMSCILQIRTLIFLERSRSSMNRSYRSSARGVKRVLEGVPAPDVGVCHGSRDHEAEGVRGHKVVRAVVKQSPAGGLFHLSPRRRSRRRGFKTLLVCPLRPKKGGEGAVRSQEPTGFSSD